MNPSLQTTTIAPGIILENYVHHFSVRQNSIVWFAWQSAIMERIVLYKVTKVSDKIRSIP